MTRSILLLILLSVGLAPQSSFAGRGDFFEQRHKGWLWFEERQKEQIQEDKKQQVHTSAPTIEEMRQAKEENEQFKEELELLRHMMVRYPDNIEYIRLYKEKENKMLKDSMQLAKNFAVVNFLNPHLADQLKGPQNIYGRDVNRDVAKDTMQKKLKELSKKIELFVFVQKDCPHCPKLEKHLHSFAAKYGFKVEAVSADENKSSYFLTSSQPDLITALGLKIMPSVIAVTNDSSQRFEIVRGTVSVTDLEERALILAKILEKQEETDQEKGMRR